MKEIGERNVAVDGIGNWVTGVACTRVKSRYELRNFMYVVIVAMAS